MNKQNNFNDIPKNWTVATLGELSEKPQYGWTTKANHEDGSVKLLRTTDITSGQLDWQAVPFCTEEPDDIEKYLVKAGDIVISRAGSVGFSYLISNIDKAVFASYLIRFRIKKGIDRKYVYYFLKSPDYWRAIGASKSGIAVPNVNAKKLAEVRVPIAPIDQQESIVSEIEKQFSRLDRAVENLKRVKANLKRYKAAVLKAAVEGNLTEQWRKDHPDVEPAAKLLERILAERRKRWEEAELCKMKSRGKVPKDEKWKDKYVNPEPPDNKGLSALPLGWAWTSLGQLFEIYIGATPSRREDEYWNGSIPWVSSGEVAFCCIKNTREKISNLGLKHSSTKIHPIGTVLLGMIGEGKTRGQAAILGIEACNNQNAAAIRVSETDILPDYIYSFLEKVYEETRRRGSGGNQPALNKDRVKSICFPLPPILEQKAIVDIIQEVLSNIESLSFIVTAGLARADRLRQSILKKAFSGQLVPSAKDYETETSIELLLAAEAHAAYGNER